MEFSMAFTTTAPEVSDLKQGSFKAFTTSKAQMTSEEQMISEAQMTSEEQMTSEAQMTSKAQMTSVAQMTPEAVTVASMEAFTEAEVPVVLVVMDSLQIMVCLALIAGNISILINLTKKHKLKQSTYCLLGNISAADTMVAVTMAIRGLMEIVSVKVEAVCALLTALLILSYCSSICGLLLFTADNYIALKNVAQPCSSFSLRTCHKMVVTTWVLCTFTTVLSFFFTKDEAKCLFGKATHHHTYIWLLIGAGLVVMAAVVCLHGLLLVLLKQGVFPQSVDSQYDPCSSRACGGQRSVSDTSITRTQVMPMCVTNLVITQTNLTLQTSSASRHYQRSPHRRTRPRESSDSSMCVEDTRATFSPLHSYNRPGWVSPVLHQRYYAPSLATGQSSPSEMRSDTLLQRRLLYCQRLFRLIALVLLAYCLIWLPLICATFSYLLLPLQAGKALLTRLTVTTCVCLNCVLNLLVYWLRDRDFRRSLIHRCRCYIH